MTKHTLMRSAASAIALISATAASAQVTAADVWADWQASLALYGQDNLTIGAETMTGDTLTVSGITFGFEEETTKLSGAMGDVTFTELGDGTVSVGMAPTNPITIGDQDGNVLKMSINQSGLKVIVSGTPEQMNYDVSADQYAFVVDEITEDGKPIEVDIRVALNDIAGRYVTRTSDMRQISYDMTAASLDMIADITPPDTDGDYVTISGKIENISTASEMTLPVTADLENPMAVFGADVSMVASYAYEKGAYIFDVNAEGTLTSGSASTGAGSLDMKMDGSVLSYDSAVNDLDVAVQGAALPFPIEVSMAQYGIGLDMPMTKTEEPVDFGLRLNLTDLAVNDMIWALADPTNAVPHDPVTIFLDLSGKAKFFIDLFDPEQAEALSIDEAPGELTALTLKDLRIKAAGVDVNGSGDFTFDNTDKVTFDGIPRPQGDLTVNIKGANALIDSLVEIGLLPDDQAMAGRLMLGMFAQVTGDDELTSNVEINEQGQVIANGQRVK